MLCSYVKIFFSSLLSFLKGSCYLPDAKNITSSRIIMHYNYYHHSWVKMLQKNRAPYLRDYAPPNITKFEGLPIQSPGQREIFLVLNGTRHVFPNFHTFVKMKFDTDDVHLIPHAVMDLITIGDELPPL